MTGPEIGGPVAVDTAEMLHAAAVLAETRADLRRLEQRARLVADGCSAPLASRLREAADRLGEAERHAAAAADGLRTAAHRYGWTEHLLARAQQSASASAAAVEGGAARVLGPLPVLAADLAGSGAFLTAQAVEQWLRTGVVAPQSDPEVVRWLQLRVSSLDDALRGFLLVETPRDLVVDDPGSPFGTRTIGALLATLVWPVPRGPLEVRRTTSRPARRPTSIDELAGRLPDGAQPAGQIRIERYEDAGGPRWIVYSAGTVTFDVDSGDEPFDLESDVRGVAGTRTDAQQSVLEAMAEAGIGPEDPVLAVGHSQGALNMMRIAERGGYHVDGVVQFGGPTEQIPAPPDVAVLQVVHAQDLVPALGGVAAAGGGGAVVVRRALPDEALRPGAATGRPIDAFPAHDMRNYRETVRQAEAQGSPQLQALHERWAGFFEGGDGRSERYRARRVVAPVSAPAPSPTAGAAPAPPASR